MSRIILTTLKWVTLLVVVLAGALWLVLAAPFFSNLRTSLVEDLMTRQLGQTFQINGDVRVFVSRNTHIHISEAVIPSTTMAETDLIRLNLMEIELSLPALIAGDIDLDNLILDGLHANLLTDADGTTSWIKREGNIRKRETSDSETETEQDSPSFLSFLSDKTVTFTNVGLLIDNKTSGFVFDFDLDSALLEQLEDGQLVSFTGNGAINDQAFKLVGTYPRGQPFTHDLSFGQIKLTYNGDTLPADQGGGYVALFELDTGEIGEIFDIFGLQRSVDGRGVVSTKVKSQPGKIALSDLDSTFDLKEGQQIIITGDVGDIPTRQGVDIMVDARMHPAGAPPPEATSLKDLKLTGIDANIVSDDDGLQFRELNIQTNAFDQGLSQLGPITIGKIYRTEEKTLGIREVTAQIGPRDAPIVTAKGQIGDVFKFKDVDFSGNLEGSSTLLLKSLPKEEAERFGRVSAEFEISDEPGHLGLRRLNARSQDTDLWSLNADLSVEDMTKLAGLLLDFSLTVADSASFLEALQVDPIDVGALSVDLGMKTEGSAANLDIGFKAAGSDISTNLSFDLSQEVNVIRGAIESDRIRLADIRDGTKAVMAITTAGDTAKNDTQNSGDQPPLQPLVLDPEEQDPPDVDDGKPPLQPLVVEDTPPEDEGLLSPKRILTKTDLEIGIELREFVGDAGVSSMSSQLVADQGKIDVGPLELHYGGGFFRLHGSMDAVADPETVFLNGATNGWDFGKILKSLEVGIDASGTLGASFDISGNLSNMKTFARSIAGTASVNMGNGMVATSLLELAGLGIFPWLFSEERAAGQTQIVCVRAPVRVNSGQISFDQVVAETNSVQLVARGAVDWVNDSITLRAEPRRVGKPLSRSAWPFDVTGKLSDPKFKLDVGGSRSRRADGADQMPADRQPCVPDIYQLE